jgi:NhaP-type Na+/H+ or K+/H+ antiporter
MSRTESKLDRKKQFFLWFAGVRGAMAFALSIKSKFDFVEVGPLFLVLTLITISFTLVYSTLFLEFTLKRCNIIKQPAIEENFRKSSEYPKKKNWFSNLKSKIYELNQIYLMPCVLRDSYYESDSPQLPRQNELHGMKQIGSEIMKINEPNEEDRSGKLVLKKNDNSMQKVEIENDSVI